MKTRLFLLVSISILAALLFSGVAFAEGEVPQAPAAEVPQAPAAEVPQVPGAEVPQVPAAEVPEAPAAEVPEAPAEETLITVEEPIILEGAPAPEEPADTALVQPVEEPIPAESAAVETDARPVISTIEPVNGEATLPAAETPVVIEPPFAVETQAPVAEEEPAVINAEPEIVLVDTAGEPLDMASETSAEALTGADPYFTSGIYTYRFSEVAGYCSSPEVDDPAHCFDSGPFTAEPVVDAIQYAINYISVHGTNPNDGNIYVEWSLDKYEQDVSINASAFSVPSALKGLIGKANLTTGVFPTIKGNVSIIGVTTGFTLSGFIINGSVNLEGNTGTLTLTNLDVSSPTDYGIWIHSHSGNVVMTNVTSSHNAATGADIDNHLGGNVTITNSAFDDNSPYGLNIRSGGIVTINGISASRNQYDGIQVIDFSSLTLKNAVINGTAGISTYGLYAYSPSKVAPVVLQNITANYNAYAGLFITTKGSISLTSVDALHNGTGVNLVHSDGIGTITLASVRADWNSGIGIKIKSGGTATLTDASANNNSGCGFKLELPGTLTMTRVSASYNSGNGFFIKGGKVITIRSLTAISNNGTNLNLMHDGTDGFGLEVYPVIVAGSSFYLDTATMNENNNGMIVGAFYNSGYPDQTLTSLANVTIRNLTTSGNLGFGLSVSRTKGTVTLTNIQANDNADGDGVHIESGSSVLLTSISASGNGEDGLWIRGVGEGFVYDSSKVAWFATSVKSPTAVSITSPTSALLTNKFDGNGANGIQIATGSPVSLSNFSASANSGSGLIIEDYSYCVYNTGVCSEGPITYPGNVIISASILNYKNDLSKNITGDGIRIISKGSVSISKTNVEDNGSEGININNTYAPSNLPVTLTNCLANGNGLSGIKINSMGFVALTNTGASENTNGHGAYIANTLSTSSSGVTIKSTLTTAYYDYSSNGGNGIYIQSDGIISVGNVTANSNVNTNIDINNTFAINTAPKSISLIRATASSSSGGSGFYVQTKGSVTLNSLKANENNDAGLLIEAECSGCLTPANVTLAGSANEFNDNTGIGVSIEAEGNIALTNITADRNNAGIYLKNDYDGSVGNVTINASTNFWNSSSGNDLIGLDIQSKGTITISRLYSNDNKLTGISVDNYNSNPLIKNISLTSVEANRNRGSYGLLISSLGAVALNNTRVDSNEQNGLYIFTKGAVTFNGVSASFNSTHNADILDPSVTINERLTSDSEGDIWRFTGSSSTAYTITLASTDFDAYLKLFQFDTVSETWIPTIYENDDYGGTPNARIDILLGGLVNGSKYYVLVTTSDQWGEPGNYALSFNGSVASYPLNPFYGAKIDYFTGTGNVSITSQAAFRSSFNENNATGLLIYTKGAVSITNTDARDNASDGLYVVESNNPTSVTIRNTLATPFMSFSGNGGYGIRVPGAHGAITISGLTSASNNGNTGAYLMNDGVPDMTPMAVTISSLTASSNQGAGILVDSKGAVTLTSVDANWNQGMYGLQISSLGAVALNSTRVNSNEHYGLEIYTKGTVSFNGVSASYNSIHEADLPSTAATIKERLTSDVEGDIWHFIGSSSTSYTIALSSTDFDAYLKLFHWNGATWDLVAYNDNSGAGVTTALISIPGGLVNGDKYYILATTKSQWGVPGEYDLQFNTLFPIYNYPYTGASINNTSGTSSNVTITSPATLWSSFSENNSSGLIINSNGIVSITGVRAENNSGYGLSLSSSTAGKTVTLTNIIAQYNGMTGVDLVANGIVNLTNVRSCVNGTAGDSADGIRITMTNPYLTTINNSTAIGNTGSGIYFNRIKDFLHLLGTLYFGNNSDNIGTEKDLYYNIPS